METIVLSTKDDRAVIIDLLRERDGELCMLPSCSQPFTPDNPETIDHIYPQYLAKRDGWTYEQINDIDNLQLMHRSCNAKKGHLLPDEDGNFQFKQRDSRSAKQPRPELCEVCISGRLLLPGEMCDTCGSLPQPSTYPKSLQRKPKECNHSDTHCWVCVIDDPSLRVPALNRLLIGP